MANICSFQMRVRGEENNIKLFHKCMIQDGNLWMGHGADADLEFDSDDTATITGWCKGSLDSALIGCALSMREQSETGKGYWCKADIEGREFITLWEACEKFNVEFDAFSEECGLRFQEHKSYIDEIVTNECVDWVDEPLEDYETKEQAEEELNLTISDEEWEEGRVLSGGFDWEFEF